MAERRSAVGRVAMGVGRVALGAGRAAAAVLPEGARKALSDRFFYAVFNVTRVTNDHYGWRPDDPGGRPGDDEAAEPPSAR